MELTKAIAKEIESKGARPFVQTLMDKYKVKSYGVKKLKKIIDEANASYRNSDNSDKQLISDEVYDMLEEEYERISGSKLEVGANVPETDTRKVELPFWMGSMDKIKDSKPERLEKWMKTYSSNGVVITDKLDGVSALLHFAQGTVKLYTRGNGRVGQDISLLIPLLKHELPGPMKKSKNVAIRGELISQAENARNAVSGLVNSKTINKDLAKNTEFVGYELIIPGKEMDIEDQLERIDAMGVKTVFSEVVSADTTLTIKYLSSMLRDRQEKSEYEIDGLVVQDNSHHEREDGKNPAYAFAFKSKEDTPAVQVKVTRVEWNISKDGLLKPTVQFPPVELSGVTIKQASGHNAEYIESNGIGPGAMIEIVRSGKVIPFISAVIKKSRAPQMPDVPYEWNATKKDVLLKQDEADKGTLDEFKTKQMVHFFTKLGTRGVASGTLKALYDNGFDTIKKVMDATPNDLMEVPGIKSAKAQSTCNAIHAALDQADCVTLMEASNAFGKGFGKKKLESIMDHFDETTIKKIMRGKYTPREAEMREISGMGAKTASQFIELLPAFVAFMKDNEIKSC